MMLLLAIEFVVMAVIGGLVYWLGCRMGRRQAMAVRLETLAKNARHKANQAKAEADVLDGVLPPRVRSARIKGTSRRGSND